MSVDIKTIEEKLYNAPLFSEADMDEELYDGLAQMRAFLCERGAGDSHLLSRDYVLGVWYLTALTFDGNPQLIIRTTIPKGEYEEMLLDKELFDLVHHDIAFDYDEDVLGDAMVVKETQDELLAEILEGRVVTVYREEKQ